MEKILKRSVDLVASFFGLIVFAIPLAIIAILVKNDSPGPAIHWSKRVGQNNKIFLMPKFRTMLSNAPQVATHLMKDPKEYLTPLGSFLRKSSLDELPQLWSVFVGDMSLVGPRPALFNQEDLVKHRGEVGVQKLKPGITGWAQVNGRDELPIPVKVEFDRQYLEKQSLVFDLKIIYLTIKKVLISEGVSH